ncbi:T9SS type A sorting domain-containing protein [Flavobacterium sp. NRK F10]|uniref:alpha/beta hydrolase family protein n=1 Tax=Flavobacterium sp. NRK F10 TaxID=2954931 RepID=UPI00209004C0|nr:T9SS type A sorting domain-containing protein [Flavobacterium sp. NRK F10]MCO6176357.1 T9SS type A sorting domain-containing protein [Flavobacterium sp. NRK F10]
MRKIVLLLLLNVSFIHAQYSDPNFPKPSAGYGSDGNHTVGVISFTNPYFTSKDIEIYHPSDISTPVPTIFYSHAYGGNNSANISGVLNFIAQKGYAVVYVPYQTTGVTNNDRYDNLLHGFTKAARDYSSVIDTTKVGFLGHSFGGGASFTLAKHCFDTYNWGSAGRFIYALAQWYTLNLSPADLSSFPIDTKLVTEVFDDDITNDHRMAIDIFNNINIPLSEKDFILAKSCTVSGYNYIADHSVPNTSAAFDALDYYAYYRLLDALCDYTFNGNLAGKDVALGNGSTNQVTMPTGMLDLIEYENPPVIYPENNYTFPCSNSTNPRESFCGLLSTEDFNNKKQLSIFPNPAHNNLYIRNKSEILCKVSIHDMTGNIVLETESDDKLIAIKIQNLDRGVYFVKVNNRAKRFIKI